MTDRPGVGAVIGRFQTPDLHEGHYSVLQQANVHRKLCIFVAVRPNQPGTKGDPLDFPSREQMLKEAYPGATVLPLLDQPTDKGWSEILDSTLSALYPFDKITLYGGRDSFKAHYQGRHPVTEVDPVSGISATSLRDIDGSTIENLSSWRRGIIYGAFNRYTPIYPCVDIVATRSHPNGSGVMEALVGWRSNENGLHRLPGGHVNASDGGALEAARRELMEETGVDAQEWHYIDNVRVKSWVDTKDGGVIITTLYCAKVSFSQAVADDDLDGIRWVPVNNLSHLKWADDHARLVQLFLDWLVKSK